MASCQGGTDSTGASINDAGTVVGWGDVAGLNHAFLADSTGMHDLNELIDPADPFLLGNPSFFLDEATGINDSGEIVADGVYTPTGSTQQVFEAFILTPEVPVAAPEPASLPLLTGGIVALLLLRRRKNTQPSR